MIKVILEKRLNPDGIIDWDGTIISKHSLYETIKKGLKNNPSKKMMLYRNRVLYGLYELLRKDSKEQFKNILSVLNGLPYSVVKEEIMKYTKLRDLLGIEEHLRGEKRLTILSKNDSYLIKDTLESYGLEKELYDKYKIRIVDIIANHFKQKNGVFTGEVEIIVNNKMEHLKKYPDLLFFGDWGDWPSCRGYKNFKNVRWLF